MVCIFEILCLVTSTFAGTLAAGGQFRYVLQPMDMAYVGTTQYFHMYVTASADTEVDITVPGTSGVPFSACLSLNSDNSWSWQKKLVLTGNLLTDSVKHGFRLTATKPINAYALRYISYTYDYVTAYHALPVTSKATHHMLGAYSRKHHVSGYDQIFVISASDKQTDYEVYDYGSTGVASLKFSGTLLPFDSIQKNAYTTNDFVGYEINSTAPVSVFAGNLRSVLPYSLPDYTSSQYTKPLFQQVPPLSSHAQLYVIGPIPSDVRYTPFYSVFITFPFSAVDFTVRYRSDQGNIIVNPRFSQTCLTSYFTGYTTFSCLSTPQGGYLEIENSKSQFPIVLECSKPCYPMLLKHTDNSGTQLPGGYMSLIAPPTSIPLPLRVFIPTLDVVDSLDDSYFMIALQGNGTGLTIDGVKVIALGLCTVDDVTSWTVLSCKVASGVHVIDHVTRDVLMSVHVHAYGLKQQSCSTCYSNAYGFPAFYPLDLDIEEEQTTVPPRPLLATSEVPNDPGKDELDIPGLDIIVVVLLSICVIGIGAIAVCIILSRHRVGGGAKARKQTARVDNNVYLAGLSSSQQGSSQQGVLQGTAAINKPPGQHQTAHTVERAMKQLPSIPVDNQETYEPLEY